MYNFFNEAAASLVEETSWMEKFPKSGFDNISENAGFGERLIYGLKICAIGMLVVFAVLAVLCLVLYLFKLYYNMSTKKAAEKKAASAVSAPAVSSAETDEETLVAVATAAIAASRNESDAAFKVISITKIN